MILTCPECATSYFVDDARIPPRGRMVKCSSCGARWRATPDGEAASDADLGEADDEIVIEGPEVSADAAADAQDFAAAPVTPARGKTPAKPKRTRLMIGGGVAAALVLALGAAIMLRQQVVDLVPGSAGAFRVLGLPVNDLGLVIEGVKSTPTFEGGRPVLAVTGAVRNTRDEAAEVPPIRITLLDRDGKPVVTKVVDPVDPKVAPAGARRYFAVSLPDPPAGAHDLEVAFAPKAEGSKAPAHAAAEDHPAQAAHEAGEAPAEAQPLPPGSPDALDHHE